MLCASLNELLETIRQGALYDREGGRAITDERYFTAEALDRLVYNAVFHSDVEVKAHARFAIRTAADQLGIYPASLTELYDLKGQGKHLHFTVPAINLRGLVYDSAREIFRLMREHEAGAVVFEIARSEIGYTAQWPSEYSVLVLAAAMREGYRGPVFLQGDHFQVSARIFRTDPELELEAIRLLIRDAIDAGFFNIDIDTSTLVDLGQAEPLEQQRLNFNLSAMFTSYIREREPDAVSICVGGEIGEVGGRNSTAEDLAAFLDGYRKALGNMGAGLRGLGKVSVQTGTTHGGIPLPDGSIARVQLDFGILERLSRLARESYGLAGVVQHGASTLPEQLFHRFPETATAEIHLATSFQNILFEHPAFPEELRDEIYDYVRERFQSRRKPGQTDEQFIYRTRKRALGPFKRRLWDLPEEVRLAVRASLRERFRLIFSQLAVFGTRPLVLDCTTPVVFAATLDREREMIRRNS